MAIDRELYSILQTGASGPGAAPTKKSEGDAVASSIEIPVLPAKDLAGNFQHIPIRASGDAAPAVNVPTLPGKDLSGNVYPVDLRAPGQAPGTKAQDVLPAIDGSGNLQHLKVNAMGELVTDSSGGTPFSASDEATSVIGTFVDVVTFTLIVSTMYSNVAGQGSESFLTSWRLVQIDDTTETILARGMSGPGGFTWTSNGNIPITSGATGTQSVVLRGRQEHGQAQVAGMIGNITLIQG